MTKNKTYTLLIFILMILSACGTKESIQRDLVVETSPLPFEVAISTNIVDISTLAEINTKPDLNDVISENTTDLTAANLKSVHIAEFSLELESPIVDDEPVVDEVNNLQAFDYIRVEIKTANNKLLELGRINNAAMSSTSSIQIPITAAASQELVTYFNDGTLTYVITGVQTTPTTAIMKINASAKYKLTLGI